LRYETKPIENPYGMYDIYSHKAVVQKAIDEGKITSHPDYPEMTKTAPKEAWQMTKQEFADLLHDKVPKINEQARVDSNHLQLHRQ